MAYSLELTNRIEAALELFPEELTQKKMFGGIAFLYRGKMTVGAINDDLMVRVVSEKMDEVRSHEFARPMDFTGRPMKEFIFVSAKGYATEEQLHHWIELGLEHARNKLGE